MDEPRRSISGFLNVDKPSDWTSSDVVAKIRAAFGLRKRRIKVGHGGTLDPIATGVLPICVGSATRLAEFVLGGDKSYQMSARLGVETDTYDSEGAIIATRDFRQVTKNDLLATISGFVGEIDQVPPMYSAIKKDGQPLYKLARRGHEVSRDPRRITVASLTLTTWDPPDFDVHIECGTGFYARSLAHDIGNLLGCGAHMTALRRTRAGEFRIAESVSLEQLISAAADDSWIRFLSQPDVVLQSLMSTELDDVGSAAFVHGQAVRCGNLGTPDVENLVRVYSDEGELLGLATCDETGRFLKPRTVLQTRT